MNNGTINKGGRPRGRKNPKFPKTVSVGVTAEQWKAMENLANEYPMSVAEIMRECFDSYLPQLKKKLKSKNAEYES